MDKLTFEVITASFSVVCLVLYLMRRNARRKRLLQ